MSSGRYFPPPVKAARSQRSPGACALGVPTVSDRIAQTAVKMWLELRLDPIFHRDSYGYRPGKSALGGDRCHQRRRCRDQDWEVEFDIRGLFDNLDHGLLMTALRKHCQESWILLYVERWLKAPMQTADGQLQARDKGTPQGGKCRVADPGQSVPALRVRSLGDAASARRPVRYADDAGEATARADVRRNTCLSASGNGSRPAISNCIRARHGS